MKISLVSTLASKIHLSRKELIKELLTDSKELFIVGDEAPSDVVVQFTNNNTTYEQIDFKRSNTNPLVEIKNIFLFYKFFRKNKIDVVLVYGIRISSTVAIAAKLAGVKNINTIVNGAGTLFNTISMKGSMIRILSYPLLFLGLHFNQNIFFQNKENQKQIKKKYFLNKKKIILINGSGVNIEENTPLPFPDEITFTFIGRLIRDKGINEFLEAATIVKNEYDNVNVKVVGSFDENITSIQKNDLNPYIRKNVINHIEWTDDISKVFESTSIFVLPSYHEGTPRTNLEALAFGRPIITTDVPGCRETVINERNGFLIPSKDVTSLSSKMFQYIENPELILKHGKESREMAIELFDINKVNDIIVKKIL